MDAKKNNKGLGLGALGLLLRSAALIPGGFLIWADLSTRSYALCLVLTVVGGLFGSWLLIRGMGLYAQAKLQSTWWGILGMFGLLGFVLLCTLPDRHAVMHRYADQRPAGKPQPPAQPARYTCIDCGYLLNGLASSACPECGRPFDITNANTLNINIHIAGNQPKPPDSGKWAIVFGLLGFALFCIPIVGVMVPAVGVVCGHIAIVQCRRMPKRPDMSGAVFGLVISYAAFIFSGGIQGLLFLS
ncbi:DUF4190 domain-containing protein [Phycisphaeraceae bacterium D3-23]